MNYHTQFERHPDRDQALALAEYTLKDADRDGLGRLPSGHGVESDDLEGWAEWAARQQMIRSHSAAFRAEYDPERLAEVGAEVAKNYLTGEWILGVHTSNPGNPHIHIAEAGREQQLYMTDTEIDSLRSELADRIGEPY